MAESATLPVPQPVTSVPAKPPANPRPMTRWIGGLLVGMAVAFAFLAGSFIARNSDLWLHLATGRLIADGRFSFGVDPFAHTAGKYWANHAWLYDLGLFVLYHSLGGAAVVVAKAGFAAATAGVLVAIPRGRVPNWLTASCVMLALLAMTPRLLLQPTIVSFLLLSVCLYCLERGGRALIAIPILIVFWVNLDSWFLLGPALVALFWLGRRIDPDREQLPPWPGWFVPASLLACLASPHHVLALTLPAELSPAVWSSGIATDPRFAAYFSSPWHMGPLGAAGGYNLAAWAFLVLLGLGLISFAIQPRSARSWRGAVWLAFAALAAWQARLIPFFAIVAAPITALNFDGAVAGDSLPRAGRAIMLATATALLGLGWLGWTVGFRNRERAPDWGVYTDRALERAATGIARWRRENNSATDAEIFTTHPDLGHYLAWFAPGEKSSFDSRFTLFANLYADYAELSRAVGLLPEHESTATDRNTGLQRRAIAAVSLYDPDFGRMTAALHTIVRGDSPRWKIDRIDGGTALIAPATGTSSKGTFDPERIVFGRPESDDISPAGNGPDRLAEVVPFRSLQRLTGRVGSADADAATIYLRLFEERAIRSGGMNRSPALPLLAIRAARRGTELDRDDPTAWLMLGRAYALLEGPTWEREAGEPLTLLRELRHVQRTTAFAQAVILNSDSLPARQELAFAYAGRGALDLAHRHAGEALRILRRAGPAARESSTDFEVRVTRLAELAERTEVAVLDAENRYHVRTTGLAGEPLSRARIARDLGLPQKAIDVLIQSHPDLYGPEGVGLLIDLLLSTGQAPEARALLEREEIQRKPGSLGVTQIMGMPHPDGHRWAYRFPSFAWHSLRLALGSGQYERARTLLDDLCDEYEQEERILRPVKTIEVAVTVAAEIGLVAPPNGVFNRLWMAQAREARSEVWRHTHLLSVHRADLLTISGVLELERGDRESARSRLAAARTLYESKRPLAPALPGLALATRYLEAIDAQR
jgi:tetratricopeptide (TPR) repeat protein